MMRGLRYLLRNLPDAAAEAARARLDELAFLWLMTRRLPRPQALELLERLGEQLGAKVEVTDLP